MPDPEKKATDVTEGEKDKQITIPPKEAVSIVLSGAEKFLDGQTHTGIAILVSSDGGSSTLMIPDVKKVHDGSSPVYITKPIRINSDHLKKFFEKKKITLHESVSTLIADAKIICEAFCYTNIDTGPLLMMFAITFKEGLIKDLTGDEELGNLFDILGASVRILRCPKTSFEVLQKYCAELSA